MKVKEIMNQLKVKELTSIENNKPVENVYIGDLLSLVMAKAKAKSIWITIQSHLNVVAVADLVDISCILVVEGMEVDEDTIKKANELEIPVFKSNKSAYEISTEIYEILK